MKQVAAIINSYNEGKLHEDAIKSVVNQTYKVKQIIVVFDYGKFNTLQYLKKEHDKFKEIFDYKLIILNKNIGISSARNHGLKYVKTDYIAFLDGDDIWHKTKIEKQIKILDTYPELSALGTNQGVIIGGKKSNFRNSNKVSIINYKQLLFKNQFAVSTLMMKTTINIKFPSNHSYMEDHWFLLELSANNLKIGKIEEYLSFRRRKPFSKGGLSSQLYKMEVAELKNFLYQFQNKRINLTTLTLISIFSFLKFLRRVLIRFNY